MSDRKFEEYKKELKQIEVPKELKEKTIARMKEQTPKRQQMPYVAAAIALLLIGVGAYSRLGSEDEEESIVIVQEMETDGIAEEVALSEGNLVFSQIPTELQSFGMQMGVTGEEEASESGMHYEYEEAEEYEGAGYEIISAEGEIPYQEESLKLAESSIGEIAVRTGYCKEKGQTIFLAYFMAGDTGYKVKGSGVTQEEFVQKVLSIAQEK